MRTASFRIGLVFTPTGVESVGVLNGNQPDAYEFMRRIQPLIDDFMERVRAESQRTQRSKVDRFVSSPGS